MKKQSPKLTGLICVFVLLLLPPLTNPATASANGTVKVVPLESDRIGNAEPLNAPSEMGPIAAGSWHTCALTATGGVICWGWGSYGQLGNNSTVLYTHIPMDVSGLSTGVSAIAAAYGSHTCALTTTGGAKCWGYNYEGQLGNNSTTDSRIPVDVSGLSSGVIAITGGLYHTCAMLMTGSMKCWGDNRDGQLGNKSNIGSLIPVDVYGSALPNFYLYLPLVIR